MEGLEICVSHPLFGPHIESEVSPSRACHIHWVCQTLNFKKDKQMSSPSKRTEGLKNDIARVWRQMPEVILHNGIWT